MCKTHLLIEIRHVLAQSNQNDPNNFAGKSQGWHHERQCPLARERDHSEMLKLFSASCEQKKMEKARQTLKQKSIVEAIQKRQSLPKN